MKYAIINSGKIGTALARTFARKSIKVAIANARGPEMLLSLKEELSPRSSSICSRRRPAHPFMLCAGNLAALCFRIWLSSAADSSSHFPGLLFRKNNPRGRPVITTSIHRSALNQLETAAASGVEVGNGKN